MWPRAWQQEAELCAFLPSALDGGHKEDQFPRTRVDAPHTTAGTPKTLLRDKIRGFLAAVKCSSASGRLSFVNTKNVPEQHTVQTP